MRKKSHLIILTFLFPAIVFAQEFRPLSDPTIACSYRSPDNPVDFETNKTKLVDYFFVVEQIPGPKDSSSDMENMLEEQVH